MARKECREARDDGTDADSPAYPMRLPVVKRCGSPTTPGGPLPPCRGPAISRVSVRRCRNQQCPRYHWPYRPEEEGKWALPHGEFGLDVIALVGTLRYTSRPSRA
jgi:hypothetical protein